MKKVICTILAMVTLSTSVSAATNVTTFGTVTRDMTYGIAIQRRTDVTECEEYTEFNKYVYVFGQQWHHSRTRVTCSIDGVWG